MYKSKPLFLFALSFFIFARDVETSAQDTKPNWGDMNSSSFPARVTRMTSHHSIDLQNNICYDNWCIGFPNKNSYEKEYPIALWWQGNHRYVRVIYIDPLTCTNDVMGELPCYMQLRWTNHRGYKCSVIAGKTYAEEGAAIATFNVNCPNIFLQ